MRAKLRYSSRSVCLVQCALVIHQKIEHRRAQMRHVMAAWSRSAPGYAHCEQLFILLPCFCPHIQCYTLWRHQPLEINAVNNKMTRFGLGIAAVTASLGLFVASASAQLAPPPAAPKAPVVTPTAPVAKAPAAAATPAVAPAAAGKAKAEKKPASPCKGLDQAACGAKTECSFTTPTKVNKATGKVQAPYCHLTAKGAVKSAVKKAGDAVKAPAATTAAPKGSAAPATGAAPVAPAKKTP